MTVFGPGCENVCLPGLALCILMSFPIGIRLFIVYFIIQSKLFIMSLFITEYSLSKINLQGTDLFPLKFPLYNRIFT